MSLSLKKRKLDWSDKAIKDDTLNWIRERFEIPDAEWHQASPGNPGQCPVAGVLNRAGYQGVRVSYRSIWYLQDSQPHKVPFPDRIKEFPRRFDLGRYPELIQGVVLKEVDPCPDVNGGSPGPCRRWA